MAYKLLFLSWRPYICIRAGGLYYCSQTVRICSQTTNKNILCIKSKQKSSHRGFLFEYTWTSSYKHQHQEETKYSIGRVFFSMIMGEKLLPRVYTLITAATLLYMRFKILHIYALFLNYLQAGLHTPSSVNPLPLYSINSSVSISSRDIFPHKVHHVCLVWADFPHFFCNRCSRLLRFLYMICILFVAFFCVFFVHSVHFVECACFLSCVQSVTLSSWKHVIAY